MQRRLFMAINLPTQVKSELARIQDHLKGVNSHADIKWVDPHTTHLTLHFLGWIAEDVADAVRRGMRQWGSEINPFTMRLGALGTFPDEKHARVIWVGLRADSPELSKLHIRLRDGIAELGLEIDSRPFAPHLTLGRLRVPQQIAGLDYEMPYIKFWVNSFELMESKLHPTGPEYSVVETYAIDT